MSAHAFLGCPPQIPPEIQDLVHNEEKRTQASVSRSEASEKVLASRDLHALQNVASMVMQKKAKEVFAIIFEDGTDIVARINGSRALQDSDKPRAEIIRRIRSEANTTIPVPEIIFLENDFDNDVGAPYSLQKRIIGRMISDIWPSKFNPSCMNGEQAICAIEQIADFECQLSRFSNFDSIGSLEYDEVQNEFHVGPVTPLQKLSTLPGFYPGPWKSSIEYLRSLISTHKSTLQQSDWLDNRRNFFTYMNKANSPKIEDIDMEARSDHTHFITWYNMLEANLNHLDLSPFDPPHYPFVLLHEDLNIGNVMVDYQDPTKVVAVIDWEGSRVVPFWVGNFYSSFLNESDYSNDPKEQEIYRRMVETRDETRKKNLDPSLWNENTIPVLRSLFNLYQLVSLPPTCIPVPLFNTLLQNFLASRPQDEVDMFRPMLELGLGHANEASKAMARRFGG
ncbi:hypothetical protein C8J55DRAFT_565264 [Lentinula edodes]|uniref:Aminoglycoside phosphotransferase domain-containing protein n=1 Tax=Lentinula lateritia TaxID=40482 RepID=A0A9W8ZW84_9AGAR|nr:hypothetical protein C8J55DRAFT_565264 [Lentinula edodes]